jgi:hypothetical protein
MNKLAIALAASVIGTAAFAQDTTTIIRKEEAPSSTTVVKERSVDTDANVKIEKRSVTTGSIGCESKTTAKTDAFGDTTVKKKTTC